MKYEVEISQKSVLGGVFSTPDVVTFKGPIVLTEQVWDWLERDVHIHNVREVRWERQ